MFNRQRDAIAMPTTALLLYLINIVKAIASNFFCSIEDSGGTVELVVCFACATIYCSQCINNTRNAQLH